MGRAPCCDKDNVKKGPWSPEEDAKLKEFMEKYGTGGNWIALPQKAGLKRCGKSCRLRWLNYLRPNIKHGEFSDDEDRIICNLFATIGSRWSIIAAQLPGRTDNDIKNYWNTKLKKKLLGIAPSQRKAQQDQQQLLFPSPSSSSQRPFLTDLEGFLTTHHRDMFTAVPTTKTPALLQVPIQQFQMKEGGSLLRFGVEQSCSSSDGSCTQMSYGQEMMGFENYPYGGIGGTQKLLTGEGEKGNGLWEEAPLEYGFEEIKQLLSANSLYVDDPTASSATRGCFKSQGRVMYHI